MNNTKSCLVASLLSLCIAGPVIGASRSCETLINTNKTDFLHLLPTSSTDVYQTLHQCAQDNFCATYVGTAACLPTLYTYTINAAYYASMAARGGSSTTSSTINTTTTTPTASTEATTSTDNSSPNNYEDINF